MNFQVTIGFNEQALSAIQELTAAIRSVGAGAGQTTIAVTGSAAKVESGSAKQETKSAAAEEDKGPFFWANNATGEFGKVDTKAAYDKLKKKNDEVFRIPESVYKEKQQALQDANEAKRQEAIAAKAEKKPAAKSDAPVPTQEDVIAVFSTYLPSTLSADERKERAAFVKPILTRFGAAKATELPEEHRALAINLVQRKMAGEDLDPATAEFAEITEAAEQAEDDLV